ncbi:MAG: ParB-like protein partition protein [Patescibacteria group bacterium]|jgi:ParB family chromosome partitioning protein|nr:ParB-like protein partition protein [Patescibacteria group bacterium]
MSFHGDSIFWVEVEKIVPNPFQPRREFDQAKLKDLSDSIRQYGVLQPLVVTQRETPRESGGMSVQYELIAGERRLRASKLAGLAQVPVIIRDGAQSDQMKLEIAIIENLQREDINAVERARAFKQLAENFKLSHGQIAAKVGKSREYVSNTIRLLLLPEDMLTALGEGKISEGHTRPLLMLSDRPEEQSVLFREILLKKITVRDAEQISRRIATDRVRKKERMYDPDIVALEESVSERLGTRVRVEPTGLGGRILIDYFSPEDIRKILTLLEGRENPLIAETADLAADVASGEIPMPTEPIPEVKKESGEDDLYAVSNFSL